MFAQTEEDVWDKIFEINVKCSWLLAKEAYPELMKRGGGSIVFISSIAGYQPMEVSDKFLMLLYLFFNWSISCMPRFIIN